MTVTATNRKNQFATNGVTTEFAFTFKITDIAQVNALTTLDGVDTPYTNFTVVENISTEGGILTTNDVLSGVDLLVFRDTSLTQQLDYSPGGRFPANSHEQAMDKLTIQNQDQQEEIGRSVKVGISSSTNVTIGPLVDGEILTSEGAEIKSSGTPISGINDAIADAEEATANANAAAINAGWDLSLGDFAVGKTITKNNQLLRYEDGLYRTSEPLPYTTDGATPDSDTGTWLVVSDGVLTGIARGLNVTNPKVVYGSVGVLLPLIVGYIHNPIDQITWVKPDAVGDGETIVSVVGDQLATNVTTYTMVASAPADESYVNEQISAVPAYNHLVLTASQTYTAPSGVKAIKVTLVGGGGGGGGVDGSDVGAGAASGGGGGGAAIKVVADPTGNYAVVIGAAGAGAASGDFDGGSGGTSTFTGASAAMTATGGGGGLGLTAFLARDVDGVDGGNGTGGDISVSGGDSPPTYAQDQRICSSGHGGSSYLAGMRRSEDSQQDGLDGHPNGGGGSGGTSVQVNTNHGGGNGSAGVCIIEEFF